MRILLTVEYDGTAYAGWQRQINGLAVQQVLEEALERAVGAPVRVTGASRTDAGVHALAQAVHFDTQSSIPPEKYPFVLNTMLPPDIRVHTGRAVPEGFHARFMACGKTYTYRMVNGPHASAIRRNTHVHVPLPLDIGAMRRAAETLTGTHDFAAFQASGGTAKTTVRTVERVSLETEGDTVTLKIAGNAFLYNMVRIIAGTLIDVGHRRLGEDAFLRAFDTLSRLELGPTAPPHGLELTEIRYPEAAFVLPESVKWHEDE